MSRHWDLYFSPIQCASHLLLPVSVSRRVRRGRRPGSKSAIWAEKHNDTDSLPRSAKPSTIPREARRAIARLDYNIFLDLKRGESTVLQRSIRQLNHANLGSSSRVFFFDSQCDLQR